MPAEPDALTGKHVVPGFRFANIRAVREAVPRARDRGGRITDLPQTPLIVPIVLE